MLLVSPALGFGTAAAGPTPRDTDAPTSVKFVAYQATSHILCYQHLSFDSLGAATDHVMLQTSFELFEAVCQAPQPCPAAAADNLTLEPATKPGCH